MIDLTAENDDADDEADDDADEDADDNDDDDDNDDISSVQGIFYLTLEILLLISFCY